MDGRKKWDGVLKNRKKRGIAGVTGCGLIGEEEYGGYLVFVYADICASIR